MENPRIWKWLVGIVVLMNIILMVMLWKRPQHPPGPPPQEDGPAKMIIEELKFNPDQIKNFERLKDEHQAAIQDLKKKGKNLRDGFFDLLKNENPDTVAVNQKIAEIGENQKQIERVTFDHFRKVRAICDADQKKHFDVIIYDILHRMAGPQRRTGMQAPPPPQNPHDSPH